MLCDVGTVEVYDRVARPIVLKTLEGFHGMFLLYKIYVMTWQGYIFAYGQTSSGKTHTMLGTRECPGIIPLAMSDIFSQMSTKDYVIRVSYLEIYQEQIKDLLDPDKGTLEVSVEEKRVPMIKVGRYVGQGAERVRVEATAENVRSAEEVLAIVRRGESNRHYGATKMNLGSSRSHTIFRMVHTIQAFVHLSIYVYVTGLVI